MASVFSFPGVDDFKGMTDLSYVYPVLQLKNPLFAGSPGLTDLTGNYPGICETGTGAVVMKSVFKNRSDMNRVTGSSLTDIRSDRGLKPIRKHIS